MIIRMLHHVPKQWGKMLLLPYFWTFPNVSLSIKNNVTATLISEALFNSLYSRLGFKFINYFATSPNFEKTCKRFHYKSGKPKALQKQTIGLKFYRSISRRVTILHDNIIDFNENKDVLKYLNEVQLLDYWFPYEYIYAEVNDKLYKTKGQLAGN